MRLEELYYFDSSIGMSELELDEQLNQMYSNSALLTESVNRGSVERLAGKNINAAFMESTDGEYVAYASDGSRTEMMVFDENRNIKESEVITGGSSGIRKSQTAMESRGFKKTINSRRIRQIIRILLLIIGAGLAAGGIWLVFGPVITVIAGALWNIIGVLSSAAGSVLSFMSGAAASASTSPFMQTIAGFLKNIAIAAIAIVGGIITCEVANKIGDGGK